MKINKNSVSLSHEEFRSVVHLVKSLKSVLEKAYDGDGYFNNENMFFVSDDDYDNLMSML